MRRERRRSNATSSRRAAWACRARESLGPPHPAGGLAGTTSGALAPYRVIDLTRELGAVCTRILAGLGADVIRIEPPGGDPARQRAPLIGNDRSRLSAWWAQMHAGKRSMTLDGGDARDCDALLEPCRGADVVVHSPGDDGSAWPSPFEALEAEAPQVIRTAITPFGLAGPKAAWLGSDLVGLAAGGLMSLCGDRDRAPLRVAAEQAYAQAGAQAAVGTLIALHARRLTGRGQLVDVSMQAAVANTLGNARLYYAMEGLVTERAGGGRAFGSAGTRLVFPAADGYVAFWRQPATFPALARCFDDESEPRTFDAEQWSTRNLAGGSMPSAAEIEALEAELERFFAKRAAQALYEEGQARGLMICPVNTMADLAASPQLVARGFFAAGVPSPAGSLRLPGAPAKLSATPWRTGAVAAAGAHTIEIRGEVACPRTAGSGTGADVAARDLFAGLRVADFSWVGVGPNATQQLAWHGAQVIRVESSLKPDTFRSGGPRPASDRSLDGSAYWANHNRDKLSVQINLRRPEGVEAAKRLIAISDVVAESFTPGFMARIGLDYEAVRALKQDVVMISMSMEGQGGPHEQFRGFGLILQAAAGITGLTGWPDRPPTGTGVAYTDWVATHFAASTLLAALDHRVRTGEGQYIDLSQLEATTYALDHALVAALNGDEIAAARGNRHREAAPHGVFPCRGEDRWCAIAVMSDEQWAALCETTERRDWAEDAGLRAAAERKRREEELEAGLTAWCRERTGEEAQERLQAAGVPAHLVATMADVQHDEQLRDRGYFWNTDHPLIGPLDYDGPAYQLGDTRAGPRESAPLLGQHNERVFRELLGYSAEGLAELVAAGVVQ